MLLSVVVAAKLGDTGIFIEAGNANEICSAEI
jgi:hypothetical protein